MMTMGEYLESRNHLLDEETYWTFVNFDKMNNMTKKELQKQIDELKEKNLSLERQFDDFKSYVASHKKKINNLTKKFDKIVEYLNVKQESFIDTEVVETDGYDYRFVHLGMLKSEEREFINWRYVKKNNK